MRLADVKVGDVVVLTNPNLAPRRGIVERVGRKLFYVKGYRAGFNRGTGSSDFWRASTEADHLEDQRCELAVQELGAWGVTLSWRVRKRAPEVRDALRPLADVLRCGE